MELTPQDRERIYREEKAKREGKEGSSPLLLLLAIGAIAGIAGLLAVSQKAGRREVSLEDLRKAYSGLSPEEEE
ncbi:MAG: hypothetical protein ACYC5N_01200 [Endomicrobiales bacterium]